MAASLRTITLGHEHPTEENQNLWFVNREKAWCFMANPGLFLLMLSLPTSCSDLLLPPAGCRADILGNELVLLGDFPVSWVAGF